MNSSSSIQQVALFPSACTAGFSEFSEDLLYEELLPPLQDFLLQVTEII